ncbi:MAG: hypothetical protein H7Y07_08890 [Pyrinomonadaceae bacterium]|nr:hypothetical protein [Sphingobacteriaceae bacterium]
MKIKLTLLSLFIVCFFSSFNFHPVNMCVGDVSYKDNKLNVKFKFFIDNLQNTVTKQCGYMDFEATGYDSKAEACIRKYLSTRFDMSVNGVPCKLTYKKGTLNNGVLLIEYQAPFKLTKLKSVKIKNTILFEENLPEMKNIMNINLLNKIKMLEFDYDEAVLTGKFAQEIFYK